MLDTNIAPIKVGILCDYPEIPELVKIFFLYAFENAYKSGVIDRPVELIEQPTYSLPYGTSAAIIDGWKKLEQQNCLAIFGPFKSDNAAALYDYVENVGHIPTIGIAGGTEKFLGEWCFDCGNGSLGEEAYLLTNYLRKLNISTAALVVERSDSGNGYYKGFQNAAHRDGIRTVSVEYISPLESDLREVTKRLKDSNPVAVLFLGDGMAGNLVKLSQEMKSLNWEPIRLTTTAYLTVVAQAEGLSAIKGWVGVDQYDEENPVSQVFLDGFQKTYGFRPANGIAMFFYDAARIIAHGIGLADTLTPKDIRAGLEKVKWLPAVSGSAGSMLNLGRYRHVAWFGTQFLLLRQVVDGATNPAGELPSKLVHRYTTTIDTI